MHLIVCAYIGSSVSKLPCVGNADLEGGVDPVVVAGRPVLHVVEAFLLLLCGSLPRRLPLGELVHLRAQQQMVGWVVSGGMDTLAG